MSPFRAARPLMRRVHSNESIWRSKHPGDKLVSSKLTCLPRVCACTCVCSSLLEQKEDLRKRLSYTTHKLELLQNEFDSTRQYLETELRRAQEELDKFTDKLRRWSHAMPFKCYWVRQEGRGPWTSLGWNQNVVLLCLFTDQSTSLSSGWEYRF